MTKSFKYLLLLFVILFTAQSCRKEDDVQATAESKIVQGAIAGVNGPITGFIHQDIIFDLVWQNTNVTTKFDHLKDSSAQNTRFIKLFALTNVPDTLTINKLGTIIPYKFKADSAGTYYLKFYRADNSDKTVIIDTVIVK